jgi:hypothetical protein
VRTQQGSLGLDTVVATAGGLWELGTLGHAAVVSFTPTVQPTRLIAEPSGGGGGIYPTVTITGHTAWIGGFGPSCASAETGAVRAGATLLNSDAEPAASITGITATSDGNLYGIYHSYGPQQLAGVVHLEPPARCQN